MNEKMKTQLDEMRTMLENFAKEQPEEHKTFEYLYQVHRVMNLYDKLDECVEMGEDESKIQEAIDQVENAIKAYMLNK